MDSITKTLCDQARAGSREAYDRLFGLHADRALLFIRARLGAKLRENIESSDVLQEAYLAAHQAFDRFECTDEGAFTRWLCRIIENRIRDLGDHFGARKRQPVDVPRSNPTGPFTVVDRAEHRERVARALESLSDDHRNVLLLRFFEGLSSSAGPRSRTGPRRGPIMSSRCGSAKRFPGVNAQITWAVFAATCQVCV